MTGRFSAWIGCGVLLASGLWASDVYGQNGYGLGFYDFGYNINYRQPPYYALFPPVYYSYPVARPYGFSPFAYPPGTMTPEAKPAVSAREYINPYVPSGAQSGASPDQSTSIGRMYVNPFVDRAGTASTASLAKRVD